MTHTAERAAPPAHPDLRVDPQRWPDVAAVPGPGVRAAAAAVLLRRAARRLGLRVVLPGGRSFGSAEPGAPAMHLIRPEAVYRRIGATGTIGFGEAYLARDWDTDDLLGVLTCFASAVEHLVPEPLQALRHRILSRMPNHERNTLHGSRANISRHYDLSNDLFAAFLDPTMTYSAALFGPGGPGPGEDLGTAQRRKIDRLLDAARVGPGTRLLEIGTGWGELALRAAARGAQVRTVTISAEQAALARRRIAGAGLADRVTVQLADYRQLDGQYDAIVSVEMIEAVGADHLPDYLRVLEQRLAVGGRVALQAITMPHERMVRSQDTHTWIRKYIFPGGQILSVPAIARGLADHTALRIVDTLGFGAHYAETLRRWRAAFAERADQVRELGFDPTFIRMWDFYLAYSEAGFRARYLDVYQLLLARPADLQHPAP